MAYYVAPTRYSARDSRLARIRSEHHLLRWLLGTVIAALLLNLLWSGFSHFRLADQARRIEMSLAGFGTASVARADVPLTVPDDDVVDDDGAVAIVVDDAGYNNGADFSPLYEVTFGADWANFETYIEAGAQMEGTRVTDFGRTDNYSFRLENVTGDFESAAGNFLQFTLPYALPIGSEIEISWWVYLPATENPELLGAIGPGLNANGNFGDAASQPTNSDPEPGDLARETPTDQWIQTTTTLLVTPEVGDLTQLMLRFRTNTNTDQPAVYFIDDISISTGAFTEIYIPEWNMALPSLAELYADYFLVGNIWSNNINMNMSNTEEFFRHQFNAVTAENHHKPSFIAPSPGVWNWDVQDEIVDWAEANGLAMIGHTLIWHSQSPTWLTDQPGTTAPLTRAEAIENMELYINTVAGRYSGRIYAWDVLNEAFLSSLGEAEWEADPDWRNQLRQRGTGVADNQPQWYAAFANGADAAAGEHGSDYVYYAFRFARLADPHAILFYNDYNEEQIGKREAIAQMVEQINARWATDPDYDGRLLIEGIGMQSHYHLDQWQTDLDLVRPAIERFIETGARIAITELDITVGGQGGDHPATLTAPLSAADQARQAAAFARLFGYYLEFSDYIDRVTIWGLADSQSWRAWGHPLLFDGDFQAKDAFQAVVEVAETAAGE